jgi:hypothetical protein
MKTMIKLISAFVLVGLLTTESIAQKMSASALAELDKAEKLMFEATSNGDSSSFRKISGVDYFTINANGVAQNLDEAVMYVPRFKGSTSKLSEQKVRIFNNFALRTGRAMFYIGDQQVAEVLYTSGWVYRDKRWQFVHWQGTPTGIMLEGKGMLEPPKN